MIKILLDECLPKKLKYRIEELDPDFIIKTTPDMAWASLSNGELLSLAEGEFDVFITSDKNLSFQQSISSSSIQVEKNPVFGGKNGAFREYAREDSNRQSTALAA